MRTIITIIFICILIILNGCTKESNPSDIEKDITPEKMYTMTLPEGDWEIKIQPENNSVHLSNLQGIVYMYSCEEISWNVVSEDKPQMVCDESGRYAMLLYPKQDKAAQDAQGAVLLDLATGDILCSYNHVDAAFFLEAFHREKTDLDWSLEETDYTICCETTLEKQSSFITTFILQAEKISLSMTGKFYFDLPEAPYPTYTYNDRMYTERIVWGEKTAEFMPLYDTATYVYEWLFCGDDSVKHKNVQKTIEDVTYYEVDDPVFNEMKIHTTADLEQYLQNFFSESFVEVLLGMEVYADIDGKIHIVGASRGSGSTYREQEYFVEVIDDTHIDLICQAKYYKAGQMEPESGEKEFRYSFVCIEEKWYMDSYPKLQWQFSLE